MTRVSRMKTDAMEKLEDSKHIFETCGWLHDIKGDDFDAGAHRLEILDSGRKDRLFTLQDKFVGAHIARAHTTEH